MPHACAQCPSVYTTADQLTAHRAVHAETPLARVLRVAPPPPPPERDEEEPEMKGTAGQRVNTWTCSKCGKKGHTARACKVVAGGGAKVSEPTAVKKRQPVTRKDKPVKAPARGTDSLISSLIDEAEAAEALAAKLREAARVLA